MAGDAERAHALARRCFLGAAHAADFLVTLQQPDGVLVGAEGWVDSSHKGVASLALNGRVEAAARLAGWIARNAFREDGELDSPGARTPAFEPYRRYTDAWTLLGLRRIGRDDLARPLAERVAAAQRDDGWFVSNPLEGPAVCDLWVACAAAWSLLACGHLSPAVRLAGALAERLGEVSAGGPVEIAFGLDEAGRAAVAADPLRRSVEPRPGRQNYHTPGIVVMTLVRTANATGDRSLLDAAEGWAEVAAGFLPEAARYGTGGKVGWGGALLWQATGSTVGLELAEAVLGYLLESQAGDGRWPRDDPLVLADTAAEFGYILAEAGMALVAPRG